MIAYRYTWGEARLPLGAFIRSVVRLVDHSAVRLRGSHESSRAVCQTKVENSAHQGATPLLTYHPWEVSYTAADGKSLTLIHLLES